MKAPEFPKIAPGTVLVAVLPLLQACGGGDSEVVSNNDNPTGSAVYAGAESRYLRTISAGRV